MTSLGGSYDGLDMRTSAMTGCDVAEGARTSAITGCDVAEGAFSESRWFE